MCLMAVPEVVAVVCLEAFAGWLLARFAIWLFGW